MLVSHSNDRLGLKGKREVKDDALISRLPFNSMIPVLRITSSADRGNV